MMPNPKTKKPSPVVLGISLNRDSRDVECSRDIARNCSLNGDKPSDKAHANRSKNRIPKSLRYDLENALLNLCDVWFQEIKPNLERNQIKVHIQRNHENAVNTTRARSANADHDKLSAAATECSHLDPGSAPHLPPHRNVNCVNFCSTRPKASRVPSRRRPRSTPTPSPQPNCCPCERKIDMKDKWTQIPQKFSSRFSRIKLTPPSVEPLARVSANSIKSSSAQKKLLRKKCQKRSSPLFSEDLINILSEKYNKIDMFSENSLAYAVPFDNNQHKRLKSGKGVHVKQKTRLRRNSCEP